MKKRERIFALLTALSLLLGLLAGCSTATAATMKLRKSTGSVRVLDDAGKSLETERNLDLYSGYEVRTKDESYAWIDLDEVKLTKLDENSSVEITQNGGDLELELKSGSLFFNITEPLEDDESLEIRTSSMVVDIRGACGWVTVSDGGDTMRVWLLEGKARCETDGERETVTAGETAVMTSDGTITVTTFDEEDIPAFVRDELDDDSKPLPDEPGGMLSPDWPSAGGIPEMITWSLTGGVLTISGRGNMEDYDDYPPWYEEADTINTIVIEPGVTSIGNEAFSGCGNLTSVTIPDGVTSIGDSAFEYCYNLTSVTIPDSVVSIGKDAFSDCQSLISVTIPDGVTSIGTGAFSFCYDLISVTMTDSVTSMGDDAFYECRALASVTLSGSLTAIGDWTFERCYSLTSVTIPDGVTSIGDFAFFDCSNMTSVTIPNSVTSIGQLAFAECYRLSVVYFNGTPAQFNAISIGDSNDELLNATIYYNS